MTYRARRRAALLLLLVGLPVYIVAAITVVDWFERPSVLLELAVYVGLGVVWALPFRSVFMGIGQPDPDSEKAAGDDPAA